MSVLIGSARIDEHGNATGGKAGDQIGKEVAIENYYTHRLGWVVLRAKDPAVAEKLAAAMKAACANPYIGYDQSNRESLYIEAQKVGFDISKVKTPCETDCSALVRVCLAYAGIKVGIFNTATEVSIIMKTGKFDKLECGESGLCTGDILDTKTAGHTVIVTQGKSRTVMPSGSTKTIKAYGTVTAGALNVRTWAGKEYPLVKFTGPLPHGTKVGICGTVKAKDGTPWYYVNIGGHYGFVSSKYIK